MCQLRFQDDAGFLDLRKLFKERRPFSYLLFPPRFVDFQFPVRVDNGDGLFLRKIRNLLASNFVLHKGALARQLFHGLFVRGIRSQPECVPDRIVVVIDDRLCCYARGRRSLETAAACRKLRVVEIVIADAHLRLQDTRVPCIGCG